MAIGSPADRIVKAYFPFGAVTTVDINDQKVFEDVSFGAAKRITIPASTGEMDIIIDPTGVTKDTVVLLPISFKAFGAGPIYIDLYFGGDYGTNGTEVDCFNRDGRSLTACEMDVRINPTITTTGTKLPIEFVIHSDGVPATATLGGDVRDAFITILRLDGKYRLNLKNQEATAADGWFGLNWFEVNKPA